jgi:CubicO group peptidase (beta-lactamase class C family)
MRVIKPEQVGFSTSRLNRIDDLMTRYVESGKLAGVVTCLARNGKIFQQGTIGYQNLENKKPISFESIFRIYSMSKPITSTALMMLYEDALFNLTDPVSKYIPAFADLKVWKTGGKLESPVRPMTIQDLLRHTAGFSYGVFEESNAPVDKLYDEADLFNTDITNEEMVNRIARLPLMFQPGEKWHYSVATDVVGYLIEVLSGKSLGDFMQEKIFEPLGMIDTSFQIDPNKLERFCTLYGKTGDSEFGVLDPPMESDFLPPVALQSGGSGLLSTLPDFLKFAQLLMNGGKFAGNRLLGPKTVDLMTSNHLPISLMPIAFEGTEPMLGMGFGLGFGVMVDPARSGLMGSVGDYSWGGYAETYFWNDPREDLIAICMTQYLPSQYYPIRKEFRTVVYQAMDTSYGI